MSGVKHTPWEVEDLGLPEYLDGNRSRFTVRICSVAPIAYAFDADEARLIAAAPDLLEALEGCIPQLELGNGEAEHIKAARAAIARARGEQDGGAE